MFRLELAFVIFLLSTNLSLSDKCNVNLDGVTKKWSSRALGEPLETEEALGTLKDAYKITIVDQKVPVLCKGSVKDLESLYELDISRNGIEKVEQGAFADVEHLRDLHLNKNKIKQIKTGVFNELGISILRLQDNQIELIDENAFDDMPNLRILYLSNNKITAVNKEWFKNTPNLHQLSLENNLITSLVASNFKNLHGKHEFYDIPAWLNIDLSKNKIESIDPKAFEGVGELGSLNLDNNEISVLHEDTFRDLRRISSVNFMFNKINCLPNHVKDILKAETTFLENNPWNCTCLEKIQQQLKWKRLTKKVHINTDVIKCKIDGLKSTVKDILAEYQ